MKINFFLTLFAYLFFTFSGNAQTIPPPYINYQAVLYDVNSANPNAVLANQSFPTFVNIQDELGNLLYKEEHFASTDANGLITVKMGDGVYMAGPITNFNLINWGVGKYYLVVDFDINGTISSTAPEQLVTVPYSFYAGKAGNGMTAVTDNGNGTLTFTYANGSTYTTPTLAGIQGPAGPSGASGPVGQQGPAGQSAYDLWLAQGNTGTVQDFLSTSAYQIWLAQGNTGTAQDFLNTLVGPQGIQGLTGAIGATGAQGIQGPAGNDGAIGPQGIQGPIGLTGSTGATGQDGRSAYEIAVLNGFVGTETQWLLSLVGATGLTGVQGPQGIQGPAGNDGATGSQGPIGLTGATGAIGPQGPIGLTGATGPQGIQGPAGNDGATGPQGPIGLTGPNGATGQDGRSAYEIAVLNGFVGTETQWLLSLVGSTGLTGAQGPQGIQGPAGANGVQGPIGLTGATGPQGIQGPAGNDGVTGPQGPIGLTGATGPQGPQGIQGPAGNDGATGLQGPIGLTGATGPAGTQGPQGTAGSNGTNGQNALVKTSVEASGSNCSSGGMKIEYGLDANTNGVLDGGEINAALTKYVCNGLNSPSLSMNNSNIKPSNRTLSATNPYPAVNQFAGFGATFTPSSIGNVALQMNGNYTQSFVGDGMLTDVVFSVYYGTGTSPAQGSIANTGTLATQVNYKLGGQAYPNPNLPYLLSTIISGLTPGIQYWFDIKVSIMNYSSSGTYSVSLNNNNVSLIELSGAQGAQGIAGVQGIQGPAGPQGLSGPTGATGPQGIQGPPGNDGATGPQGPIGLTGATGPQGPQGIQGPAGAASSNGIGVRLGFSNSTTWVCPSGVTEITVQLWGGGGGGGAGSRPSGYAGCKPCGNSILAESSGNGGNGGAGGYYRGTINVVPGTTYTITIGAGGTGGVASTVDCNNPYYGPQTLSAATSGGSTSFHGLINAPGGNAGQNGDVNGGCINGLAGSNGVVTNYDATASTFFSFSNTSPNSYVPAGYSATPLTVNCCSNGGVGGIHGTYYCPPPGSCATSGTAGEKGYLIISY